MVIHVATIPQISVQFPAKKESIPLLSDSDIGVTKSNNSFSRFVKPLGPGQFSRLRERHNNHVSSFSIAGSSNNSG